jgi:hypothetical protein
MEVIFDRETEMGQCDFETVEPKCDRTTRADPVIILAHTQATLNGSRAMLKIEHQCYLRHGDDMPDQPWIRPEVVLEPSLGSLDEMIELAEKRHNIFLNRARLQIPEQLLRVGVTLERVTG